MMVLCISALHPDKWIKFKLQEKAKVSHNTQLYRLSSILHNPNSLFSFINIFLEVDLWSKLFIHINFRFSFDPNLHLGLDVASCLITRQVYDYPYGIKFLILAICHLIHIIFFFFLIGLHQEKMLKEKQNMLFARKLICCIQRQFLLFMHAQLSIFMNVYFQIHPHIRS